MKARKKPKVTLSHLDLHTTEVENPLFSASHAVSRSNPKMIPAVVNVRESAISTLAARGVINAAQVAAATRFRSLWEAMGGAGAGAFDYTKEFVDGGRGPQSISDKQLTAGKELKRCRDLLGLRGFTLVRAVCGEGHSLYDIGSIKRERLTAADNLRACLDDLAAMWGYSTPVASKKIA